MNRKLQTLKYLSFDYIASAMSWTLFYLFRKIHIEPLKYGHEIPVEFNNKYFLGLLIIPLCWLILFYIIGYYKNIYRKSRLEELGQTLLITLIGVLVIFFALILDDEIFSYKNYYVSILTLFSLQFLLVYIPRLIITTITNHKIQNRDIGFNTLIIGSNDNALKLYQELNSTKKSTGNKFIGFINVLQKSKYLLSDHLPLLGGLEKLNETLNNHLVEEVIIALESSEHEEIESIINQLQHHDVIIKIIPDMHEILTGTVKMTSIYGAPLIQISHASMPAWQENMKRIIDISASIFALILLTPLYLVLTIGVKLSSKGPIFYSHERIGRYGNPFTIYKFRSMYTDAEKNGPALSSSNDSRITPFGKFMRKSRLDELPQFFNVVIGDMSLVGPRPERQFFIDQIILRAPHYAYLHKVRPGITSWGQVKYGYAENVDEMIDRLKYDILYLENMSLFIDFKIMIYTIKTILKVEGK